MGLPVKKFIAAVNINSPVPEYLRSGRLKVKTSKPTLSNAMDVGNPSNWARIVDSYQQKINLLKRDLEAIMVSDIKTKETIKEIYKKYGYILDPHTAVGVMAASR